MKKYVFDVHMSYAQCEDLYIQQIKYVVVHTYEGKTLRLPKENLKRFLLADGINGRFELVCDANNKLVSLSRSS